MYLYEGFESNCLYVPSNVYKVTKRGIQVMKNKHILVFLTWNLFWWTTKIDKFVCLFKCLRGAAIQRADYLKGMHLCAVAFVKWAFLCFHMFEFRGHHK